MTARESIAIAIPPMFLRLALAVTFMWAGLGKWMADMSFGPEQQAALQQMGVSLPAGATPAPTLTPEHSAPPPADAEGELIDPENIPEPADTPPQGATEIEQQILTGTGTVDMKRLYALALGIQAAAGDPGVDETGQPRMRLLPEAVGDGAWPIRMAWAVMLVEALGGAFLLVGFLTRFNAVGIAMVMVGAIWLTEIGPAIQARDVVWGFLPNRPTWDGDSWKTLLWQFSLLMSSLALVFSGSGALALDNLLFRTRTKVNDGDDD